MKWIINLVSFKNQNSYCMNRNLKTTVKFMRSYTLVYQIC